MTILSWRGVIALLALVLVGMAPAEAAWRRAESPNFLVYSGGAESNLRLQVQRLEDFDHLLRILTGVSDPPAPNKLRITLLNNHRQLNTVGRFSANVAGFYLATVDGIGAFVDRSAQDGNDQVLFHEYAHHFMMQYRPNAYPAWYVEGFAEYFMTVNFTAREINIGQYSEGRIGTVLAGGWLPMEQILGGRPPGRDRERMAMFYSQSWLMVHYFYSNPERQAALRRYLVAARSMAPAAALESATGMTTERFERELHSYIGDRSIMYRRMARSGNETPATVTITTLPESADDLMVYDSSLRIGLGESQRAPYLEQIRTIAARYPVDPYAMRVQAHVEALYGDGATADRLLDRLLAASPNDGELMYLKGMRHLVASEQENAPEGAAIEARRWFARAHRLDENHYQTLYRFVQCLRGQPTFASENSGEVLLLAHQLAPQVSEITMNAAVPLLRPLAADPHHAELARTAREMIDRAEGRSPAGPEEARPAEPAPQGS